MTDGEKAKKRFRQTKKWLTFRHNLSVKCKGIDLITGKRLIKGFSVHHLDLNEEHYSNIENEDNFVCLNKQTHETLHWLWRYYEKDESILERLREYLDKMKKINS